MLFAVGCVGGWRFLVETGIAVRENEPNVEFGMLFPQQMMFLSVLNGPNTLRFDIKKATGFRQLEVRSIRGFAFRPCVFNSVRLVENLMSGVSNLFCCLRFQTTAIATGYCMAAALRNCSFPPRRLQIGRRWQRQSHLQLHRTGCRLCWRFQTA